MEPFIGLIAAGLLMAMVWFCYGKNWQWKQLQYLS